MSNVVICNDLYPQFDIEKAWEDYKSVEVPQLLTGIGAYVTYLARCERYGLTPEVGESAEPVTSDLPVLVVNGGIDIITPKEWGGVDRLNTCPTHNGSPLQSGRHH